MNGVKTILESLGYKLKDDGRHWRTKPIYRESGNNTSLRITKKNGRFIDFSAGIEGSFKDLVQISLGLQSSTQVQSWLDGKQFVPPLNDKKPINELPETWTRKVLDSLIKNHSYWESRGIKPDVLERFEGGVMLKGRMADRYVFPIFGTYDKILGFAGRDITGKKRSKWKLIGRKKDWVFPLLMNRDFINTVSELIIVEGISDVVQLWQFGYENSLCLFGVKMSDKILNSLLTLQLDKVIIATNNDLENGGVGNTAATDIYRRIIGFVNPKKVQIKLPLKKDFQEMTREEVDNWRKSKVLAIVGGRDFSDYELFKSSMLGKMDDVGMIVSGGATGADTMGKDFANHMNIPVVEFLPKWGEYGAGAGYERNTHIINNADRVIAFWDGKSRGTASSIEIARRLSKPLEIVKF